MKLNFRFLTSLILAASLVIASCHIAKAESLSDSHKERIRANCVSAKDSLNRLHVSDALLRVNRGQLYESMSTKLMTRFNSRLSSNQLEDGKLESVADSYSRVLGTFRQDYMVYEQEMSAALKIDCQKQPELFYETVASARAKRLVVYQDITNLNRYIDNYETAFIEFLEKRGDAEAVLR